MDGFKLDPFFAGEGLRLADSLKERTHSLHRKAERSGIVAGILRGTASRHGYAVLLRNLHPVYTALERALEAAKEDVELAALAQPAIYRSRSLDHDLTILCGAAWRSVLPLLPAAERYVRCVEAAAEDDATRLYGHAYTRYLGDLNGGQMLRRLLAQRLNLEQGCLSFYDFPEVADLERFRTSYREAINRAPLSPARRRAAVEEGALAFAHNISLSLAIEAAESGSPSRRVD